MAILDGSPKRISKHTVIATNGALDTTPGGKPIALTVVDGANATSRAGARLAFARASVAGKHELCWAARESRRDDKVVANAVDGGAGRGAYLVPSSVQRPTRSPCRRWNQSPCRHRRRWPWPTGPKRETERKSCSYQRFLGEKARNSIAFAAELLVVGERENLKEKVHEKKRAAKEKAQRKRSRTEVYRE